jgi:hypothetical protein
MLRRNGKGSSVKASGLKVLVRAKVEVRDGEIFRVRERERVQ